MRWLSWLAVLVLLVLMSTCELAWLWECATDSDCDDGNPCTRDVCDSEPDLYCDWESWCDDCRHYYCRHWRVDDGTPCEVDGQAGICEAGKCRLDGETHDAGVSDGGV